MPEFRAVDRFRVSDAGEVWFIEDDGSFTGPLRQYKHHCGYLCVEVNRNHVSYTSLVHRLVARAFLEAPLPDQWLVRHLNDNKNDNRVCNLAWGTSMDNWKDYLKNAGEFHCNVGSASPHAKINEAKAYEIKKTLYETKSVSQTAYLCGVSKKTVEGIRRGNWSHVIFTPPTT
ncbi:MAG TPA: HNH endonuclease [Dissulfurispiraceae bacterium]|nr:HNH endonuclease [Dissulfurispiraceae bacterium]